MMDGIHSQTPGAFQIQRAVVDEKTLFGRALRDLEGQAKDQFFRFARWNVTGTEENQKISSKMERLNSVLIELQRLIIDGPDEYLPGGSDLSRIARVSGYSFDWANMNAVNSSRVK